MRVLTFLGLTLILLVLPAGTPAAGAPPAVAVNPTAAVTLTLGAPRQLLPAGGLDMTAAPDMHTAVIQMPDKSYHVYITGRIGARASNDVATWRLTTRDFLTYALGTGGATNARPVLDRSCDGVNPSCLDNFDADYAGANAVFPAANGKDLLMIYHGETRTFGGKHNTEDRFYAEIGLARSTDQGLTWTRLGAIISGADPKPSQNPRSAANGVPEPGAIIADNYVYVFYPYFPTAGAPDAGPSTIQVARAPLSGDGAPGTWTKYYDGSFGAQAGLGGLGSAVVATGGVCTGPRQPWVTFSTYLHSYVMVFLCSEGWFFSTSTDLVTWNSPTQFFAAPAPEFTRDQPTDENIILMTPGNLSQMVIGRTGYVLYAHTPAWGRVPHELWLRPFTFSGP